MNLTAGLQRYTHRGTYGEWLRHIRAGHHRTPLRYPLPLQMVTLVIVALVILPLVYLLIRALGAGEDALADLLSGRTLAITGNSIVLAGAVVGAAMFIGVPFAWLTARSDLPLRRVWLVAGLLTMVIPSYLGAVTYIAAFGPRGMLQQLLEPITGVTRLASIYGFFGAWLAITLFTYPYVVLPVRAALMNMDPALEETARSMGLRRWQVFRRVVLPQLRPALAAGTVITALYTLSDFGAVAMMRYNALTRAIYVQYTGSFDRHRAAILALVLVILTIMLLIVERRATKHTHNYRVGTGAQRRMRPVKLGRWRLPALVFCGTLVTVGALVPVGVLFYWLMQKTGSRALSLDLNQMLFNTISVSGLAALVVAFAALPLGLLAVRSSSRVNQWLVRLSYFGYVLPGIVVALALVFFAANYLPGVYQTLPILLLGYSTRFLPLSVSATQSALTQVNPRYEEVARCLGLNRRQVLLRISVPLARAGILGGAALVFLNVMKELPTTLILAPTGFKTFSMHIWSSYEAATLAQIGAPGLLLVAVSAISLYLILGHERQEGA